MIGGIGITMGGDAHVIARLAFVLFALIALGPVPALAQSGALDVTLRAAPRTDAPEAGKVRLYAKSKALVIGIDSYTERGWPKLSGAVKDALGVADALKAQGFVVTLLKDLKSDDLDRALKDFFVVEGADPEARLLLWFAGHDHTIDGEGYIVPADAVGPDNATAFRRRAISVRRFGEYMREAKAKHVLAIFDSCFSGSVFNVARATPPAAITLATAEPVRQFVSSGEAEQLVADDGTFRQLFLDALAGREPQADANGDGYITGSELGLFLHDKLTNLTGNKQTPRYGKLNALGYDRGDFVFEAGQLRLPPPVKAVAGSGASETARVNDSNKVIPEVELGRIAKDEFRERLKKAVEANNDLQVRELIKEGLSSARDDDRIFALGAWFINNKQFLIRFDLPPWLWSQVKEAQQITQQRDRNNALRSLQGGGLRKMYDDTGGVLTFQHNVNDLSQAKGTIWSIRGDRSEHHTGDIRIGARGIVITSKLAVGTRSQCSFNLKLQGRILQGEASCLKQAGYVGYVPFPVSMELD